MMERLFSIPALLCGVLGIASPICFYLFFSAKAEIRRIALRTMDKTDASDRFGQLTAEIAQLRSELKERVEVVERSKSPEYSLPSYPINLNKRGQILQLHRKGNPVSSIASVLHVAQAEVRLVIKVHQMSKSRDAQGEGFSI